MIGIRYEPGRHKIVNVGAVHSVRRALKDPDIFCYQHRDTGNYMLAVWVRKGSRLYELLTLGKTPRITSDTIRKVSRMRTTSPEGIKMRRALRERLESEGPDAALIAQQEAVDELDDAKRELRAALTRKKRKHGEDPYFASVNSQDSGRVQVGYGS